MIFFRNMNYYLDVLKKYAIFTGRARRKEYWMFVLINFIITFALYIITFVLVLTTSNSSLSFLPLVSIILLIIYALALLIPSLAVGVRRLHDTNHSGWWYFISLVPFIGSIVLLIFLIMDSQPGINEHGPNPKGIENSNPSITPRPIV